MVSFGDTGHAFANVFYDARSLVTEDDR